MFNLLILYLFTTANMVAGDKPRGMDFLLKTPAHQQNLNSIPCIVKIAEKYLRKNYTYSGSIIIINFAFNITVLSNLLSRALMTTSDYKMTVVVKNAHALKQNTLEKSLGFNYKSTSYFMCVNATWEIEVTIK